jgi:hypothetical protein
MPDNQQAGGEKTSQPTHFWMKRVMVQCGGEDTGRLGGGKLILEITCRWFWLG